MLAVFVFTSEVRSRSGVAKRVLIPEIVRLRICFVMCVFVFIDRGSTCIILFSCNGLHYILWIFQGDILLFSSFNKCLNVRGLSNFKKRKVIFS